MTPTKPQVNPNGLYSRPKTAEVLGISPTTLDNYSKAGFITYILNRYNMRKKYSGKEIIRFWEDQVFGNTYKTKRRR